MRRGLWIAVALAGLGLAVSAPIWGPELMQRSEAREAPPEGDAAIERLRRVVMVTTVRARPEHAVRRLPGTIAARTETELGFRVGGKVLSRTVSAGDRVKAGEVVARLDTTDLQLELEAAEADLAAARIALDKAEISLERVTSLESRGWASDQASDIETVAAEEARARVLRAERNADLARNRLSYAALRADADGIVTQTSVEPGQVVAVGQPVVRMARAGAREAVVAVPEAMLADLEDAEAVVELWSAPGRQVAATLRELSPVADSATRTFEARYALADAEGVALGMSVTVSLTQRSGGTTVAVPISALFDNGAGPVVWVVEEGRLEARPVTVAELDGDAARVVDGLAEGDRVVVLGAHKLQAGEPVRTIEAEA